jgi:succinate dehydrogenase / fumarate reductase cytochrome b subunit
MWLLESSIGKKLIMSISGLFLILFLLFHMSMNVVAIFSADAYNAIAKFLGTHWYALVGSLVLAAGVVIHFVYAIILTLQNQKARGDQNYAYSEKPKAVEFASQNMFVLGLIILLGLVMHLLQFWAKMQFAELMGHHEVELSDKLIETTDGAAFIAYWFSNPIYCIIYLIWLVALWFHLTHGFWSAFQTIGFNNKVWFERLKCISNIVATLIVLGFAAVVIAFFLKSICCPA